jgi:hypothetical protein
MQQLWRATLRLLTISNEADRVVTFNLSDDTDTNKIKAADEDRAQCFHHCSSLQRPLSPFFFCIRRHLGSIYVLNSGVLLNDSMHKLKFFLSSPGELHFLSAHFHFQ